MKSFEVMFESYPQLILNIFIMLDLQIYNRPLNLASAAISLLSIAYGISDVITFNDYNLTNEDLKDSKYIEAPYIKFIWALLAVTLDTIFRTLFIAYLIYLFRFYMFLFPLVYILAMFNCICITKKQCNGKKKCMIFSDDFLGILYSFITSLYEDEENVNYSFRFFSKIVINTLALISFICIAIFYHQYHLNNLMFEIEFIKDTFTQHKDEKCLDNCNIENLSNYCDLPMPVHNFISVILWILCIFSTIEGILELFCNCMPYRRFYQKSDEIKQDSVSPNELESCL